MSDEKSNTGATTLPPTIESLRFLSCDLASADQFADLYSKMLNDAKLRQDLVFVRRMQKILIAQSRFMVREFKAAGGRYAFELHEGPEPKAEAETVQ
jgi:hypothetical protein